MTPRKPVAMPKPLPCPFCGGPAKVFRASRDRDCWAWVRCNGRCQDNVKTRQRFKTRLAIEEWNARYPL